ncbi:MAG: hypothetical protein M3023_00195 [Pseudomonadota bacterium]|nr:hypothetical protein [Pseudomonadota bacterium]
MADEFASATPPPVALSPVVRVRSVDAGRGAAWWSEGWRLFTPAVGTWILIVLIGFGIQLVLAFIPFLGSIASQLLFPILAGGLMLGCRAIDRGELLTINHLFAGFGPKAGSLLIVALIFLGVAIAILFVVLALLFVFFGAALLSHLWSASNSMSSDEAMAGLALVFLVGALLFLLLYLPLVMAIWFAPALIVFKGVEPWEAMKLSFMGGIKNILPFLIYGLIWIGLAIVASIPFLLGWLVLGPVTVASVYASYCDIFEQAPSAAAVPA